MSILKRRWMELAHRAIDDACYPTSGVRKAQGGPLTKDEAKELNDIDSLLGYPFAQRFNTKRAGP